MSGRFIGTRTHAIMTTRTVTGLPGDGSVIKYGAYKTGGVVADIARLRGNDMVWAFASGDSTVMAVLTQIAGL